MEQMKQEGSESEKFITSSILSFLNKHIQSSHLNTVDEIVLSYVVTVLESLATEVGSTELEDSFDVNEFCEMLTAYFPEFTNIPHEVVSQWIFDLVASLKELAEKGKPKKEPVLFESLLSDIEPTRERLISTTSTSSSSGRSKRNSESSTESNGYSSFGNGSGGGGSSSSSSSCSSTNSVKSSTSRTPRTSETSDLDSEVELTDVINKLQLTQVQVDEYCETLMDMFPTLTLSDAQTALLSANGDLEKAVQLILSQLENEDLGASAKGFGTKPAAKKSSNIFKLRAGPGNVLVKEDEIDDEKVLKDRIFARYGFIDKAEDKREFRPPPLKTEPKKMVRYRESQVVSTKGERYSEVRCKDGGEIKPYIHKPNKQYN